MTERDTRSRDIKPADALGTYAARTRASRYPLLIIGLVGLLAAGLLVGLIVRTVTGNSAQPDVPQVDL